MKPKADNKKNPYQICYDNYMNTNADTECTGLLYQPAHNHEEWENSHEIFNFYPGHKIPSRLSGTEEK